MIVDERIVTFINSLDTENSRILEEIEKEAHASDVPVIRREMQSLLKVLLMLQKPMRILEVGTAIGFSALLMSEYAPDECRITTIENYEKRIPIARSNFARAGKEDVITLIEGDAAQVLEKLEGAQYAEAVQEDCIRCAKKQGYVLTIEDEKEEEIPYKKVILKYYLAVPFSEGERAYQITGYSHWKGGEER